MKYGNVFEKFLAWRSRNIRESYFIIFLSFLIGIFTSACAFLLKYLIHLIKHLLTHNFSEVNVNFLYLLYPAIGILIAGLYVRYIVKDNIGHGITKILYAISQRKSYIKPHNMYTSIVASSITIGFGGSVGAEAPIVLTGSAIGSNLGRLFRIEQKHLMLLIGCGAAGAIAGIFKAPIAGLVFVIEVLMLDLTMATVTPLLVASLTAATFAYITTGTGAMFHFAHAQLFAMERIPYVILLGLVCGLISLYFTRAMNATEDLFHKLSWWKKYLLGATILSILIFLFPPLYGEGYDTIDALLSGLKDSESIMDGSLFYPLRNSNWGIVGLLGSLILFKVFATSSTNGAGGTGGTFAPSLFLGCVVGFAFAYVLNKLHLSPLLPNENFALMGMAGVMAGVMHAPLTGTFLIAELTGGYELLLPLLMVSTISFVTISFFEPHSIYAMRLAKKGELITHHKDKAVLTLMDLESIIENNFQKVTPDMSLGDIVKLMTQSSRNIFPVVDHFGVLVGIVLIDNIRNIMFRPELYDRFKVSKIMVSPPAIINNNMQMNVIMELFDKTKAWNLPVVDEKGVYLGFVSKSSILNNYRKILVDNFSEEV